MLFSLLVVLCAGTAPNCTAMTSFQYRDYPTIDACQADANTVRHDPKFGTIATTYCFQQQRPPQRTRR